MNTIDLNTQTSRLPNPSAATIRHRLQRTALGHSTSLLGLTLGLLLLAGCASSSPDYDGVYRVTGTPASSSSSETGCAPFKEDVVVQDGRVESQTHDGVVGDSADKSCQWGYRAKYRGTENKAPSAD